MENFLKKIEDQTDSFLKILNFLYPKFFKLLENILIVSTFLFVAQKTENKFLYIITFVSLGFIFVYHISFIFSFIDLIPGIKILNKTISVFILMLLYFFVFLEIGKLIEILMFQFI